MTYTASDVAEMVGCSTRSFNAYLVDAGVQFKSEGGHYLLCEKYLRWECELTELSRHVHPSKSRPGDVSVAYSLRWTDKGAQWIAKNWSKIVERANEKRAERPTTNSI